MKHEYTRHGKEVKMDGERLCDGVSEVAAELIVTMMTRAESTATWPKELTPELRDVLGMMCFQLGPIAHIYQAAGEFDRDAELKKRAEDEQAFMLHKFVGYVFEHGSEWRPAAADDIERAQAVALAKKAKTDG